MRLVHQRQKYPYFCLCGSKIDEGKIEIAHVSHFLKLILED
jgi:hypothetical protein